MSKSNSGLLVGPERNRFARAPWRITGESASGRYITVKAATGRTVARIPWSADKEGMNATDHYDAILIEQAPELLKLLREFVKCTELDEKTGKVTIETQTHISVYGEAVKLISNIRRR